MDTYISVDECRDYLDMDQSEWDALPEERRAELTGIARGHIDDFYVSGWYGRDDD